MVKTGHPDIRPGAPIGNNLAVRHPRDHRLNLRIVDAQNHKTVKRNILDKSIKAAADDRKCRNDQMLSVDVSHHRNGCSNNEGTINSRLPLPIASSVRLTPRHL